VEFEDQFTQKFDHKIKQIKEMEDMLKELGKDSPNIVKNIDRIMAYVEAKEKEKKKQEKKESFIGWLLGSFKKKAKKEGDGDDEEVNTSAISDEDDDDGLTE
jgi:septum formation inhibitor MinC